MNTCRHESIGMNELVVTMNLYSLQEFNAVTENSNSSQLKLA
jgi:hypothetical protein